MSAQNYKVTFGYGAVDGHYYGPNGIIGPWHRANDRAMPVGVPVIITDTQIGLSGNTGLSGGPHLHTQAGTDIGCQKTVNPTPYEFQPGTVVAVGTGNTWGKYVTMKVGSQYITYAHLSQINVKVGQVISAPSAGGTTVFNNEAEVQEAYLLLRGVKATTAEAKAWVGQPKQRFFVVGKPEADAGRAERDALRKQLAEVKTALANEQAKPPKEVVKVVEKIVTKEVPVEVIKTVPAEVDEKQVVSNVLLRFWNSLFKKG